MATDYLKCTVTMLSEDGDEKILTIRVDDYEDEDSNLVNVEQEAEIELLNVRPKDRDTLRNADYDEEITIYIDSTWMESEGIV